MTVNEFHEKLTEMYPRSLSAEWDNDGIMVSADPDAEVRRVLVALDATDAAIRYASEHGFDTLLVHHPMIFGGQKSVLPSTFAGKRIIDAIGGGVSVISLHTRLDAGRGGVNDALLETLGFRSVGVFGDSEMPQIGRIADIPEMTARELAVLIKEKLGCGFVRLTGDGEKIVHRLGVCGGAGGDLLWEAIFSGCDVFLTGECGYNKSEDAAEEGLVTLEAGHYYTEVPVCRVLADLAKTHAGAECEFFDSNPSVLI